MDNDRFSDLEEFFKEEIELLEAELLNTDDLYDEVKKHYDQVKNSRNPGVLKFLADQSKTLASLRTHKLGAIKDKISVKKTIFELDLKERNFEARNEGDTNIIGEFKELAKLLNKEGLQPVDTVNANNHLEISDSPEIDDIEEDLDDRMFELITDRAKAVESLDDIDDLKAYGVIACSDSNGKVYLLHEETSQIVNDSLPELEIFAEINVIDGEEVATLPNKKTVPIIEFE